MNIKTSYVIAACLSFSVLVGQAQLFQFSFSDSDSVDGDATESAVDLQPGNATVSVISRGSGVSTGKFTPESANTFTANNFVTTATLETTNEEYVSFTITPAPGYELSLTRIEVDILQQRVAPENFVWRSSNVDSFATDLHPPFNLAAPGATADSGTVQTSSGQSADLDPSEFNGLSGSVEFRLYGWGALSTSGQRRAAIDNLKVYGSVIPVSGTSSGTIIMISMLPCLLSF